MKFSGKDFFKFGAVLFLIGCSVIECNANSDDNNNVAPIAMMQQQIENNIVRTTPTSLIDEKELAVSVQTAKSDKIGKEKSVPMTKKFECDVGEVLTKMKGGEFGCCPPGKSVCYAPIIKSITPAPRPVSVERCSDKSEILTKMKNGEFACCPEGASVCYPTIK